MTQKVMDHRQACSQDSESWHRSWFRKDVISDFSSLNPEGTPVSLQINEGAGLGLYFPTLSNYSTYWKLKGRGTGWLTRLNVQLFILGQLMISRSGNGASLGMKLSVESA